MAWSTFSRKLFWLRPVWPSSTPSSRVLLKDTWKFVAPARPSAEKALRAKAPSVNIRDTWSNVWPGHVCVWNVLYSFAADGALLAARCPASARLGQVMKSHSAPESEMNLVPAAFILNWCVSVSRLFGVVGISPRPNSVRAV